ncbi:MAG: outer membrane lipoprotein-sorting protein [Ignavibacteriaceae bacterium]|nr:outer membrane lipoprotein-sorting protein [Ignavibacteriaceae bacterium]
MFKKVIALSVLFIIFFIGRVSAQSLDEILSKHFEIIGQKSLSLMQTLSYQGNIIQSGTQVPVRGFIKRPNMIMTEINLQGVISKQGFDGVNGWIINPFTGDSVARPASEEELELLMDQADMDGLLYNYEQKGFSVRLLGQEDLEGQPTFVIELVKPSGNTYKYYLDARNYVILKTSTSLEYGGSPRLNEYIFSNYKKVQGILVPFKTDIVVDKQMVVQYVFDDISFNRVIEDALFQPPAK